MAADGVTAPDAKAKDRAKDRAKERAASPDRSAATPMAGAPAPAPVPEAAAAAATSAKARIGDHMKARLAAVASGAARSTARARFSPKDAAATEPTELSPGAKARALLKDRAAARHPAKPSKDQNAAAEPSASRAGAKARPMPPHRTAKAAPAAATANTPGKAAAKDRPQARRTRPSDLLEPVLATAKDAAAVGSWTEYLVLFLRVMAAVTLAEGIYHWAALCGIGAPAGGGFEQHTVAWRTATVFFAVIDLVAGVGLWLAAAWGAVVWLTAVVSMAVVEVFFPQVYGGSTFIVLVELALVGAYLWLAIVAARERPA